MTQNIYSASKVKHQPSPG